MVIFTGNQHQRRR